MGFPGSWRPLPAPGGRGFLTKVCRGPGDRSPCASAKWREPRRARLAAADLSHARANARTKSHRVGCYFPCPAAASRALHPPTVAIWVCPPAPSSAAAADGASALHARRREAKFGAARVAASLSSGPSVRRVAGHAPPALRGGLGCSGTSEGRSAARWHWTADELAGYDLRGHVYLIEKSHADPCAGPRFALSALVFALGGRRC